MRIAAWSKKYQGKVLLDRWSISHFAWWLCIGMFLTSLRVPWQWLLAIVLIGAVAWELVELTVEKVKPGMVVTHETYINRWISDIIMGPAGGFLGWAIINPLVS